MKIRMLTFFTIAFVLLSGSMIGFATSPTSDASFVHPLTTTTGYVYFNESGLPSGTEWSVLYNSLNLSSTTASIKFSETVNLYYTYTIHMSYSGVTAYTPSPASGSAKAPSEVSVSFSGSTFSANLTTNYNPTDEDHKTWYYSDPSGPAPSGHYYVVFPYIDGVNTTTMSVSSNGVVYDGYYLWSQTGSNTIYFFYHVNGTNLGFDSVTLTVTVNPLLSVTISAGQSSIDYGQSVTFESSVSGGTPPYFYQWILNGANVTGATNSTWTTSTLPIGTDYIKLQVTDSVGDPSDSRPNASIPTIISQDNLGTNQVYIGDPVNITIDRVSDIILKGNYSDFTYQWYGPGGPIAGATSWYLNIVENTAGFYNFAVHIRILNNSLPYRGTWIGHFHLTVKNNILPNGSVEFIESGLPIGAAWSAALYAYANGSTSYYAIEGVGGFYTTVAGNGLPTIIITPPNGTYKFFVTDYKWGTVMQGLQGWVSPGNYTANITSGMLTFPLNTANGSIIIHIQFTPINSPSNIPLNISMSNLMDPQSNNSTISPLPTTPQSGKTYSVLAYLLGPATASSVIQNISERSANFVLILILSIIGVAFINAALVIKRLDNKKQRDKEANQ